MDCLVEGVPTYGIPIPGGAFGGGDQLFTTSRSSEPLAAQARGGRPDSTPSSDGLDNISASMRSPLAWHERISQRHDLTEVDRRWRIMRADRPGEDGEIARSTYGPYQSTSQSLGGRMPSLNGFSVPSQHRLGDDDLHFSLCAAMRKHAQRQFESRLPPWLSHINLLLKSVPFYPPTLSTLPPSDHIQDDAPDSDSSADEDERQDGHRPPVKISRVRLLITASDIYCEIWRKRKGAESSRICPWGLCVVPRPSLSCRPTTSLPQVDHLTGGLLDPLSSWAAPSVKNGQMVTFRSKHKWCSLLTQNHIWYMLGEEGSLYTLLLRQSPVRVISNLLVFEQRAKASRLCALNGWNATQLPVLTLFLGLRFRELNEIRLSLNALKPHQEMEACQMVMDFIHAGYSCASLTLPFQPSSPRLRSSLGTSSAPSAIAMQSGLQGQGSVSSFDGQSRMQPGWQTPSAVNQLGQSLGPMQTLKQNVTWAAPSMGGTAQAAHTQSQQAGAASVPGMQQAQWASPNHPAAVHMVQADPSSNTASAFAAAASHMPADRSFVSRLLEIAMQFVTKLIQTRVAQVQRSDGACRALTYLQPAHAASEPARYAAMVNELSQLTVHMQSLRSLQQQLIRSFGDDRAYDSGIVIQCPQQEDRLSADNPKNAISKTGLPTLDAAVALATKLQAGCTGDKSDPLDKIRSAEAAEAIVRAALINGRVSSALIYFHELAQEEGRCGGQVFADFRVTAGRLAYQLVCNQQVDFLFVAMHMLRNVGESVNRFFKAVAFHTAKRLVRRRLLMHLLHMRRLTKEEQDLISLVHLLEKLYTNPCYTTEFNRMTTSLTTGRYPQRAMQKALPPFYSWPAGGHRMLLVGLSCDGAIGGHVQVDASAEQSGLSEGRLSFDQQTSVRELPMSQRMPLELNEWAVHQSPGMVAMLEVPSDARRAWNRLPCGDVDDLDSQPVLGLANFHQASNLEGEQESTIADMRDLEAIEPDNEALLGSGGTANTVARTTCKHCKKQGLKDDAEDEWPKKEQATAEKEENNVPLALGLSDSGPKNHILGYLHVTLSWMRRWSWSTRARILMEKTHFYPDLIESLPWLQPPPTAGPADQAWRRCWLDFLVAHQDWRGLASWVRCMPLDKDDRVDNHGLSRVDLTHLEERGLTCCTSYHREILLQELGRRGIFCHADTKSFPTLLRRLAQCGRLFGEGYQPAAPGEGVADNNRDAPDAKDVGILPLDRLLPFRDVCPFHRFFIHFCIDRDLPTVMLLYLQNYKLAATIGDLKALDLKHSKKPWASLLLVGRLGNAHLFAASLQNAAIVYGGVDQSSSEGIGPRKTTGSSSPMSMWRDADDVPLSPLNGLATRSPKAFLATLMFAPVASALDAAEAPADSPWHVELERLWKVAQEYPTLREALFLANGTKPSGRKMAEPADLNTNGRKLGTSLVESVAEANRARWSQAAAAAADALEHGTGGAVATNTKLEASSGERTRHTRVDDMLTFKEDVSLSQLLSDIAAFDVKQGLRPLPIFRDDIDASAGISSTGSLTTLVEQDERFYDELGEGYFLAQGRAMMAFHVLLTKCARRVGPSGELKFPLVLPVEETRRLHKVAKSVALYNLLNEGVVSSAVCLLELCSLETEMLRVDVQAAKRIYEHNVRQGVGGGEDWDRSRAAAASVIELFLSFPDIEDTPARAAEAAINSQHLLTALRMLEESTWALDPHPSAPSVSSLQALAYDSPWHLVALFCRVHSLPRSLTLLHELARNNDWVMFLHESDLQQCPADTVLDIVDGYFMDTSLQSHLRILARTIAVQEQDGHGRGLKAIGDGSGEKGIDQGPKDTRPDASGLKQRPEPTPGRSLLGVADAIGFLERCRGVGVIQGHGTGWGLLRHAQMHRAARLAVVASAFNDVSLLQCMAVWLSVNTERGSAQSSSAEAVAIEVAAQSSPTEVAAQIALLCRKSRCFSLVLRALKIFDPNNPLVDFVKFHRAFFQCRFETCRKHLRRFVTRRDSESSASAARTEERVEGPYCLELVPHVVALSEEMVQYLLDGFPQARMMLLSALHQAKFSPHYSHLFCSFRLIQQTGLDVDFRVPAGELLQMLISRKMFAEAREWAQSSGIVGDTIVFEEVTGMIVEFRQGVWWNVLDERLQLWHECYCAFMRQSYPPVGAAHFFLDITSKLETDLFAREQLMLLCIAYELLCSSTPGCEAFQRQLSPTGNGGTAVLPGSGTVTASASEAASKQPAPPSKEQMSRIELSMLLILTGTNKDLAGELDFSPLDLSYSTLRTLAKRVPEGVKALKLCSTDGPGGASGPNSISSGGAGQASGALAAEHTGEPPGELLPFLDTAISSLINCDEIAWAKRLADGFGFASVDLHLAQILEKVASGHHQEALKELTLGQTQPDLPPVLDGDAEPLLRTLCTECTSRVALFCRRCQVFFAVSRSIGMGYHQVSQIDVGELLDRLLSPKPFMGDIALCRSLLSCYPKALNKATLAEVLAKRFLRSTLSLGQLEWPEEKLDEFVSLLESSPELLGDAALRGIPHFRSGRLATQADTQAASSQEEPPLPLECEAEVLIMAYRAYVQACFEKSIGDLLHFLQGRVAIYVDSGRFSLLVRLLVAIPEYHAMEYMFGHLVRHGQLDLLLKKGSGCSERVAPALPVALVRYLQDHFPRDFELLVKVHLSFGLVAQLGDLLEDKAKSLVQSIGRKWEQICTEDGEEKLLMCLSLFLQCSRFFMRGKRYQKHLVANEHAALIGLQLKAVQIHLAASLAEHHARREEAELEATARREMEMLGHPSPLPQPPSRAPDTALAPALVLADAAAGGDTGTASNADADGSAADSCQEAIATGVTSTAASETADTGDSAALDAGTGAPVGDVEDSTAAATEEEPATADRAGASEAEEAGPDDSQHIAAQADAVAQPSQPVTMAPISEEQQSVAAGADALIPSQDPVVEEPGRSNDKETGATGPPPLPPLGSMGDPFVVINLEAAEVKVFAEYHHDFVAAFQVISAYKHTYGAGLSCVWPRALYRQVVLLGNRAYLQQFLLHLPLCREMLEKTVKLYLQEPCPEQFPLRSQRMKQFLRGGVPNLEILFLLARQLGNEFADITMETASLVYMA
eukprot:TRINITY_DN41557_c0_g2_i1.p1 TRINITY_DN41557_c0_g2~~TRINITY_DN41557_c0_g2_i1.p1  ORF type:complete len:3522 (-),score=604.34 TRINITY_DN41557_c0_g2_i1:457-9738(-)